MDERLVRLRVELYTAAQSLTGEDADEFWKLIEEIHSIRFMHDPKAIERVATEIRHRNEDLVPGRIVHLRGGDRCFAAVLTQVRQPVDPEDERIDLLAFLPNLPFTDPHWNVPRADTGGALDSWHFSIACPFKGGVASG